MASFQCWSHCAVTWQCVPIQTVQESAISIQAESSQRQRHASQVASTKHVRMHKGKRKGQESQWPDKEAGVSKLAKGTNGC